MTNQPQNCPQNTQPDKVIIKMWVQSCQDYTDRVFPKRCILLPPLMLESSISFSALVMTWCQYTFPAGSALLVLPLTGFQSQILTANSATHTLFLQQSTPCHVNTLYIYMYILLWIYIHTYRCEEKEKEHPALVGKDTPTLTAC